jgi:hypothetical protein
MTADTDARVAGSRSDGARCLACAAGLWPDPRSDTALFLRLKAIVSLLGLRRYTEAARLVQDWPLRATPRFVLANLPRWGRLTRQAIRRRRYWAEENPDLLAQLG